MADTKIIVNKHYRNPSDINQSVFSNQKKINKYGIGKDEYLREGEIVICNNTDNPGLYIMTESASTVNPGRVINMTGAENIKLSTGYTESSGTGEYNVLVPGDTLDEAFGKLSKQIKDVSGDTMPNVGDGLKVITDEHGVKTLNVSYDNFTIIKNNNGELQVDLDVVGGSVEILSTTISSFTQTFIGLDGNEHAPGVYMIMEFGRSGGTSTYTYSDITSLINLGSVYLSEDEYAELVENDQVDPNVTYYTYEE